MSGHQPKIEKTCGTCRHIGRSPLKDICLDCAAEAGKDDEHPEWQPKIGTPPTGGSSGAMWQSILTTRVIPHDEARDVAQRLINSHFRQEPHARVGIPARPDYDDDLLIHAYIEQQRGGDHGEIARLKRRETELLEANDRYLQRARAAEAQASAFSARNLEQAGEIEKLRSMLAKAREALSSIEMESRRYADFYPVGSDGRNTFGMFCEFVRSRSDVAETKEEMK